MNQPAIPHLHPKMRYVYVGVDSHKKTHTAVFLTCFYEHLGTLVVPNVPSEFTQFLKDAKQFLQPHTEFAFAFEDTTAYGRNFVKFLHVNGYLVKHTNANLVASERNSKNTLNKSDTIDAEACARVLLNRFDELPLALTDDKMFIFKNLVSRRKAMVKMSTMLKNQLHALLPDHYPTYFDFFSSLEHRSALGFYETYPSPSALEQVSLEELTTFFKDLTGKGEAWANQKATRILKAVKSEGIQPFEYQELRDFTISSIVRQIRNNLQEIEIIKAHLEDFLNLLDIPLTSMKGIDTAIACSLIAEIGNITRFKNAAALAKYAGISPATYASGQSHSEYANKRGNRELGATFHQLALALILERRESKHILNPIMHQYYHKKLSEGKTKKQALKAVKRRLVTIVYGIMKYKHDFINPPTSFVSKETIEQREARLYKTAATFNKTD